MIKGKAVDYTHDGRGVVKTGKELIFVPDLMIGEEADISIVSHKKSFSIGKVEKRLTNNKDRVVPPCPYFEVCGGCQLQHMSYPHQLKMKQKRIEDALKHIAKLYVPIERVIQSKQPFQYRNKIQMAFANQGKKLLCGFYQAKTKSVIQIDACMIEHEEGNQIIAELRHLLESYHIKAFDPETKKGWIKHAVVKKGVYSKEIMLIIISQYEGFKKQDQIISALIKKYPMITTIVHQVNPSAYKVIGNHDIILHGPGYIKDTLEGFTFKIRPQSFYQVNPEQAVRLYNQALELANISSTDVVLDAYSGVGTISLFASKYAKKVVGVELIKDAVEDAKENAIFNKIKHVEFVCEDATTFIKNNKQTFDVIIVDPPRDGLQQPFIEAVMESQAKKFVYISCEPSSLARDLKILKQKYHVKKVIPVDMFSQTYHIESVTLLEKK